MSPYEYQQLGQFVVVVVILGGGLALLALLVDRVLDEVVDVRLFRRYRDGVWSDRKIDRALRRYADPKIAAELERIASMRDGQ